MQPIKRYSHCDKKKIDIQQSNLMHTYNSGISRVDLLDRMLRSYGSTLHNEKWWWNLFVKALNITVVASYLLYSAAYEKNSKFTYLEFPREFEIALQRSAKKLRMDSSKIQNSPLYITEKEWWTFSCMNSAK